MYIFRSETTITIQWNFKISHLALRKIKAHFDLKDIRSKAQFKGGGKQNWIICLSSSIEKKKWNDLVTEGLPVFNKHPIWISKYMYYKHTFQ